MDDVSPDAQPSTKRPGLAPHRGLLLVGGILLLLVGVLAVGYRNALVYVLRTRKFSKRDLEALADVHFPKDDTVTVKPGALPCRAGRVLILDQATARIDDDWLQLPREVRATAPEDVDTLIIVCKRDVWLYEETRTRTGAPTIRESGWRERAELSVYDLKKSVMVGSCVVEGAVAQTRADARHVDLARWVQDVMPRREGP